MTQAKACYKGPFEASRSTDFAEGALFFRERE